MGRPDRPPPGGRAVTLTKAVVRRQGDQQLGLVASGAAFWLVIAALPTAIAVVSLYGLVVDPQRVARDLSDLLDAAPDSLGSLIGTQLQHVAATQSSGVTVGLVVSVVLAVWSASAGVYHLEVAIRDAYGLPRQRYVDARARALAEAAVVVVALGAIALTAATVLPGPHGALVVGAGIPAVFVGLVAAVAGLYRFALGRPTPLRALVPGAVAAAAGMILALVGFGAYASASTHFTAVYGGFGAAVIAMMASYVAVYATLLGAVLNAEREDTALGQPPDDA